MEEEYSYFLGSTRRAFQPIANLLLQARLTGDLFWENLQTKLLAADLGPPTTQMVIQRLQQRAQEDYLASGRQIYQALRQELLMLLESSTSLRYTQPLTVMLLIGLPGSGTSLTSYKLKNKLSTEGHKVLIIAPTQTDEQSHEANIDASTSVDLTTVVIKRLEGAPNEGYNVALIDASSTLTATIEGRVELKKLVKAIELAIPGAPHELLPIADATEGVIGVLQMRTFAQDIGLTGMILTKIDSTALGGCAFAFGDDLGLPIKFLGTGESLEDLVPFNRQRFVDAILPEKP